MLRNWWELSGNQRNKGFEEPVSGFALAGTTLPAEVVTRITRQSRRYGTAWAGGPGELAVMGEGLTQWCASDTCVEAALAQD